jgi:enoyl-CoA hydratase/carnithine racemase
VAACDGVNNKMKTESSILLKSEDKGIVTITLNRPTQYNALSSKLLALLQNTLNTINENSLARVVIIKANGRAFCAGHDLKEMRCHEDKAFHLALFQQCSQVMLTINQMQQPVIAQVDGIATAAGCQLVAACDLAIASNTSRFAVSGINVGLFCSTPSVALSRNLARKRALELLLTGDFINAYTAHDYGLINQVVEEDALEQATIRLAKKIVDKSSLAIGMGKKMFYEQLPMDLSQAYQYATQIMAENMDSQDAREGIDAFIEKRQPIWQGK